MSEYLVEIREMGADDLLVFGARAIPFQKIDRPPVKLEGTIKRPSKIHFGGGKPVRCPQNMSAFVSGGDVRFDITSTVPKPRSGEDDRIRAWGSMFKYGIDVTFVNGLDVKDAGNGCVFASQSIRATVSDGHDWGVMQLRNGTHFLRYRNRQYSIQDTLTLFFYRAAECMTEYPFPPALIANRFYPQNYLPITVGQLLFLITPPETSVSEMQGTEDFKPLKLRDHDTLYNSRQCFTYMCVESPTVNEAFYVNPSADEEGYGVLVPGVHRDGDIAYAVVLEPYKTTSVACQNINAVVLRFAKEIPPIEPVNEHLDIALVDTEAKEVLILLSEYVQTLTIHRRAGKLEFRCDTR